tara:strand:- start:353 stop:502 length:150 start_codon:yes stop_codon:yes gene_type:complete
MKDIEYEKDGVKKFAQERFKEELEAVGWKVVKKAVKKPAKKTQAKKDDK